MKDDAGAVGGEGQPASGGHAEAVGADSKLAGGGRVDDIDSDCEGVKSLEGLAKLRAEADKSKAAAAASGHVASGAPLPFAEPGAPAPEVAAQLAAAVASGAAVATGAAAATAPAAAAPAAATAATAPAGECPAAAAAAPAEPGLANQKDSDLAPGTHVITIATKDKAKWDNQSATIIESLANFYRVQLLTGPKKGTVKHYAKRFVFAVPGRLLAFAPAGGGDAPAGGGDAPAGGGGASISGGGAVSSGGGDASRNAAEVDDDDGFAAFS